MSLVIAVAVQGIGAYLVGDKRVSVKTASGMQPYSDSVQKIFRINQFTALGVAGNYEAAIDLSEFTQKYNDIASQDGLPTIAYPDEIADTIHKYLLSLLSEPASADNYICITGIDRKGRVRLFTLNGKDNYCLTDYSPIAMPIQYSYLGDGTIATSTAFENGFHLPDNAGRVALDAYIIKYIQDHIASVSKEVITIGSTTDSIIIPCPPAQH